MSTQYPEPQGYCNRPGFVKSNPQNNDSYLEQSCKVYPEWADILRKTHEQLQTLVPGYNIAQIKEKFWELRYYIDIPSDYSDEVRQQAWDIASQAERDAPAMR